MPAQVLTVLTRVVAPQALEINTRMACILMLLESFAFQDEAAKSAL